MLHVELVLSVLSLNNEWDHDFLNWACCRQWMMIYATIRIVNGGKKSNPKNQRSHHMHTTLSIQPRRFNFQYKFLVSWRSNIKYPCYITIHIYKAPDPEWWLGSRSWSTIDDDSKTFHDKAWYKAQPQLKFLGVSWAGVRVYHWHIYHIGLGNKLIRQIAVVATGPRQKGGQLNRLISTETPIKIGVIRCDW